MGLLLLLATGCGGSGTPEGRSDGSVRVITSVLPHADVVRRVGGRHVRVEVLVPPGAAPSTYEPSVRELRAMADAELFVRVGHPAFPFERAWLNRLMAERPDVVTIDASVHAPDAGGDPHVWHSLPAVRHLARELRDRLAERRPEASEELDASLAAFEAEVNRVDAMLRDATREREGRAFYVFHPAWGHVAAAYGVRQIAIEDEGKEPSAAHVGHVIDVARASDARIVFVQPQHAAESTQVIAEEIGAEVRELDPLPADWVAGMHALAEALKEALAP